MSSNENTLAKIKERFPDLEITIIPTLGFDKGIGNPEKVAGMKRFLKRVNYQKPTKQTN